MKYFFWIAFAIFLAASIPHVAYFFASFEPSQGSEGLWWWVVSYAIAISIDVTVYLLSWTAFQKYRRYRSARAVWKHWLLIVLCTLFSWAVNWAYAKQFHSHTMLNATEGTNPWLTTVFPFMASAFPLLGIVYTMMAETVSETEQETREQKRREIEALTSFAMAKQITTTQSPKALTSGKKKEEHPPASITGKFVALDKDDNPEPVPNSTFTPEDTSYLINNADKLQLTMDILRTHPNTTDEALAKYLSLKRPASARFWRIKAVEILSTLNKEQSKTSGATRNAWDTTDVLDNENVGKR